MRSTILAALMMTGAVQLVSGCVRYQIAPPIAAPVPLPADSARLTAAPAGAAPAKASHSPRELVLLSADELLGTRYRYGGSTPERGFDCSGFVHWVYSNQGVELPRTARAMSKAGTRIPARRAVLLPGDLLFFAEAGGGVSHVAIYAGDGRIVHASSGEGEVRYEDLDSARGQWFRRHIVSARRVIGAE